MKLKRVIYFPCKNLINEASIKFCNRSTATIESCQTCRGDWATLLWNARRAVFHLRNVIEEASRSTSASAKLGSSSPPASSEMARTALEKSSGDSSNRQTSMPLLPSSPSGGDGASVVSGGAAIAGEGSSEGCI